MFEDHDIACPKNAPAHAGAFFSVPLRFITPSGVTFGTLDATAASRLIEAGLVREGDRLHLTSEPDAALLEKYARIARPQATSTGERVFVKIGTAQTGVDRGLVRALGLKTRVARLWVVREDGRVVLGLRAQRKRFEAGLWDVTAAGMVRENEVPVQALAREAAEEAGLAAAALAHAEFLYTALREESLPDEGRLLEEQWHFALKSETALTPEDGEVERFEAFTPDEVDALVKRRATTAEIARAWPRVKSLLAAE